MSKRTQIICLHEGEAGHSIDPIFIHRVLKDLDPAWIRPFGSNKFRPIPCGGCASVIREMPNQLKACLQAGSDTTLLVLADLDDNMHDGDTLKGEFWKEAQRAGIDRVDFDKTIFLFPKDRLENWIEFIIKGDTNEGQEGERVDFKVAADAAKKLAVMCKSNAQIAIPPSLEWSCLNWRVLVKRMTE